jgi:hypothetical protein
LVSWPRGTRWRRCILRVFDGLGARDHGRVCGAGELVKASGRHEEAFRSYEALLRDYIGLKQKGAERVLLRLCSENPMGSIRAQSGGKCIHLSRTGEAGVRAKHYRQVAAAGLPLAVIAVAYATTPCRHRLRSAVLFKNAQNLSLLLLRAWRP